MAAIVILVLTVIPKLILAASYDPLKIHQPSIDVAAEQNGFISLQSGDFGDVRVQLHDNNDTGSIYFDGEDLLYIIEIIESQPPYWLSHGPNYSDTPYGYLGSFYAGSIFRVNLSAVDPEGIPISYSLVAGNLPPGIKLDPTSGHMTGIVPDADATYVFTMRATDGHMKYADNVFKMVVRGYDRCVDKTTCLHEGVCHDIAEGFTCSCIRPYGGKRCDTDCRSHPLGISQSSKAVSDAQITGYHMYSSNSASQGRIGGSSGWYGIDKTSYIQVDLGDSCEIYRVDTQYISSNYYVSSFYIQYSLDGSTFSNFTDYRGRLMTFSGATSSSTRTVNFSEVLTARYVRLFPLGWNTKYRPGFKIELYGCHNNK